KEAAEEAAAAPLSINNTQNTMNALDAPRLAPTPPTNEREPHGPRLLPQPASEPVPSRETIEEDVINHTTPNQNQPPAGLAKNGTCSDPDNKFSHGTRRKDSIKVSRKPRSRGSRGSRAGSRGGARDRKQPDSC
ncbi:hypothetical protein PFISCL1PPCAC_22078, partial [Pristionchus fissidentatus]